jgi:trans-aconitate methyltransferase
MTETQYLFGDNDVAARRLELLARIYAESTRAFLLDVANGSRFNLEIDLGCGPGFTTHLLADALRYEEIVGLDASQHFIDLAQATATDSVAFALHDVRFVPFPCKSADLIFSRLLSRNGQRS